MGEPNPPRRRMKALDATAREMVELEAGRAEAEQRKAAIGRYDDVRAPQQSVPRKQREGSEGTAARMGSWTQGRRRNRSGRPQRAGAPSTWKWVLGAVVVALVIWQVAQGVFVKSFSMLGVDVSF